MGGFDFDFTIHTPGNTPSNIGHIKGEELAILHFIEAKVCWHIVKRRE